MEVYQPTSGAVSSSPVALSPSVSVPTSSSSLSLTVTSPTPTDADRDKLTSRQVDATKDSMPSMSMDTSTPTPVGALNSRSNLSFPSLSIELSSPDSSTVPESHRSYLHPPLSSVPPMMSPVLSPASSVEMPISSPDSSQSRLDSTPEPLHPIGQKRTSIVRSKVHHHHANGGGVHLQAPSTQPQSYRSPLRKFSGPHSNAGSNSVSPLRPAASVSAPGSILTSGRKLTAHCMDSDSNDDMWLARRRSYRQQGENVLPSASVSVSQSTPPPPVGATDDEEAINIPDEEELARLLAAEAEAEAQQQEEESRNKKRFPLSLTNDCTENDDLEESQSAPELEPELDSAPFALKPSSAIALAPSTDIAAGGTIHAPTLRAGNPLDFELDVDLDLDADLSAARARRRERLRRRSQHHQRHDRSMSMVISSSSEKASLVAEAARHQQAQQPVTAAPSRTRSEEEQEEKKRNQQPDGSHDDREQEKANKTKEEDKPKETQRTSNDSIVAAPKASLVAYPRSSQESTQPSAKPSSISMPVVPVGVGAMIPVAEPSSLPMIGTPNPIVPSLRTLSSISSMTTPGAVETGIGHGVSNSPLNSRLKSSSSSSSSSHRPLPSLIVPSTAPLNTVRMYSMLARQSRQSSILKAASRASSSISSPVVSSLSSSPLDTPKGWNRELQRQLSAPIPDYSEHSSNQSYRSTMSEPFSIASQASFTNSDTNMVNNTPTPSASASSSSYTSTS